MQQYHRPRIKKVSAGTGGKRIPSENKRLAQIGSAFTATKVSDKDVRSTYRVRGGNRRLRIKKAAFVNVVTKNGMKKAKILGIVESHNPEYVRQNIITKGAVLNTEVGKVRVTNRVGQDGVVNGILF